MSVEWAEAAQTSYFDFLAYLMSEAPSASVKIQREVVTAVEKISRRPKIGRASRWPGLREWSLTKWRKIVVYRIEADRIIVVAFYDARQDLTKVQPEGFSDRG